jgi:hypothetical protein
MVAERQRLGPAPVFVPLRAPGFGILAGGGWRGNRSRSLQIGDQQAGLGALRLSDLPGETGARRFRGLLRRRGFVWHFAGLRDRLRDLLRDLARKGFLRSRQERPFADGKRIDRAGRGRRNRLPGGRRDTGSDQRGRLVGREDR